MAANLAELIELRSSLTNTTEFTTDTLYHIVNLIEDAARDNYHFRNYIETPLKALKRQYELRYWPSIQAVVNEIAYDAENAPVYSSDPRTDAATSSQRPSNADFSRAIISMIDELKDEYAVTSIPDFKITDAAIADIVNVCLKLGANEMVSSTTIKNLRHRDMRKKTTEE